MATTSSSSAVAFPPLTTAFVAPPSCYVGPFTATTYAGTLDVDISIAAACFPPNPQIASKYSPGMCMYDWTTVVSNTQSDLEIMAACCPTNYSARGGVCASAFTTSSTVKCLLDANRNPLPSGTCVQTVVPSGVATRWPMFVAYKQQDLSLFPSGYTPGKPYVLAQASTTASSGSAVSRAGQTGSSTATNSVSTPSNSSSNSSGSSGLSTAAKIGIGLGIPLAVLLIAAIFLFGFVWGKRKRKVEQSTENAFEDNMVYVKNESDRSLVEAPVQPLSRVLEIHELETPAVELDAHTANAKTPI